MPEMAQFDYAKLPDGSYAKFAKGTSRDDMQRRLLSAGLLKGAPPSKPAAPEALTRPDSMGTKVTDIIGQGVESAMDLPSRMGKRGRELYQQAPDTQGKLMAPLQAENEEVTNLLKGVYSSTAPGMIGQKPEQNIANAIMMQGGSVLGGEPARGTLEATASPGRVMREVMRTARGKGGPEPVSSPAKAGPLLGSHSRAVDTMNRVDSAAKGIPIDWQPAYKWAQKAIELGKRGFTVPKPVTDFVSWVDSRMKPGLEGAGEPNAMIDRGGTMNPLEYQHARDFEVALGAKIPWDQDTGGKMGGLMKRMRESLGQSTAQALKPYNLDTPYLRSKADFTKAYGAEKTWGPFGYFGGKIAGYGIGSAAGHPLLLGYAGGRAGENIAGSLVRSVTGEGK